MKSKVTTDSNHNKALFEAMVNRDFNMSLQNKMYAGGITYVSTRLGLLYLTLWLIYIREMGSLDR
jgi:putative transposase